MIPAPLNDARRAVPARVPRPPVSPQHQLAAYYTDGDVARYLCVATLFPWLTSGVRFEHSGGWTTAPEAVTANYDLHTLVLEWIAHGADEEQVVRLWRRLDRVRILDPTCGDGAFLVAALHVLERVWEAVLRRLVTLGAPEEAVALGLLGPLRRRRALRQRVIQQNLFGVDLDRNAVCAAVARLQRESEVGDRGEGTPNVVSGNTVTGFSWDTAFPNALRGGGFDIILGNPPFVHARQVSYRPAEFRTEGCPNLYAWVVEQSLRLLAEGGRLGMVLPVSATCGPDYRPLAELYLQHDCWISTYSNRPAKLFEGVEQRLALLITGPANNRPPELWTSAYQHWTGSERPGLFERLAYTRGVLHDGMPAKIGSTTAASVLGKLDAAGETLRGWETPGEHGVWLHNGPTYWVRALPFEPNAGQRASSHYRHIPTATQEDAEALAAVLSSSTFYFWFKAVGNCRDLGRQEWEHFPVGTLSSKKRTRLAALGRELSERLRTTARERRRRYPGGTVVYEEYYPALEVEILDRIDKVLGKHYDFTEAELDYIRNLDRKYRLGRTSDVRE